MTLHKVNSFSKWNASSQGEFSRESRGARLPMSLGSSASFRRIVQSPMSLGSSASFRRIVPFRDTSTTESEIPSFRDAPPWQFLLAPRHCEERSDVAIQASGTSLRARPMSLGSSASFRRIVSSRDTSTMESEIPSFRDAKPKQSCLRERIASPFGFAMTVAFK